MNKGSYGQPPGEIGSLDLGGGYNKVLHFCVVFNNKDFFSITCFLPFPLALLHKILRASTPGTCGSVAGRPEHLTSGLESGVCGGGGGRGPEGVHRM